MFNFWLVGWFSRKVYSPWFCTMGDDWGKGEMATRVPGETPPRRPALQTGDTRSVPRQNLNPGPLHCSGDNRVPYKWILWDRRLQFYQTWSHIFGDMYDMKHTTNATEVRNFSTSDSLPQAPPVHWSQQTWERQQWRASLTGAVAMDPVLCGVHELPLSIHDSARPLICISKMLYLHWWQSPRSRTADFQACCGFKSDSWGLREHFLK